MRRARFLTEFAGPLVTAAAAVALELLSRTVFWVPNPQAVFLPATVYSTLSGGIRPGLISAGIALLYLAYFVSAPGQPFRYSEENLRRLLVWVVATVAMVVMVGVMKRRGDRASDEIVRRERDHSASLGDSLAQRRRAEEALRTSEERYRLLFERNLAGIFRARRDGRMLECNAAFFHLLGYTSRDELLAHNAREFYLDVRDRERVLGLLQPGVVVSNHELQWRRADGSPIWVLVNVREVAEGSASYLEGIVIDITDRKRAELGLASELAHDSRRH
jgi:PAS domain S-box-containing protein